MRSLKPMTLPETPPTTAITPLPVAYCFAQRNSCAEHPMWQIAGRKKRQEAAMGRRRNRQKTGTARTRNRTTGHSHRSCVMELADEKREFLARIGLSHGSISAQ